MVANSAVHEATWRWIRIVTFARSRALTRLLLPLGEKGSEVQVCAGRKLDLKPRLVFRRRTYAFLDLEVSLLNEICGQSRILRQRMLNVNMLWITKTSTHAFIKRK